MKTRAWVRPVSAGGCIAAMMMASTLLWAQNTPPVSPVERVHASREAVGRGDLAAALQCADQAIAADPAFGEGWKQRGRTLMLMDRGSEAEQGLARARKLMPEDPDIQTWLDLLALQRAGPDELARQLHTWSADRMKLFDERMAAHLVSALMESGHESDAADFLARWAPSADSGTAAVARTLADLLGGKTRDPQGLVGAADLQGAGPLHDMTRQEIGMRLIRANRLHAARAAFEWARNQHPGSLPPLRELGWTLRRMGDAEGAIKIWSEAGKNPAALAWGNWISDAWLDLNKPDQAMEAVNRVLAGLPKDADALERKYSLLLQSGEDGAPAILEQLKTLPDGARRVAMATARASLALSKPADAVTALDELAKNTPNDTAVRALLIRALMAHAATLGKAEAVPVWRRVLDLDPGLPGAWRDLGWGLWATQEKAEALKCFAMALECGLVEERALVLQVYALLVEDKRTADALSFLDRHLPGESRLAIGMELVRRERSSAAIPALEEAWSRKEQPERTGLYLAFARITTGAGFEVSELIRPALATPLDQWDPYDCEMTLETLRQAADASPDMELMKALADRTAAGSPLYGKITDLIARAAARLRSVRKYAEAAEMYLRVLDRDPNRVEWPEALDSAELANRQDWVDDMLRILSTRAQDVAVRDGAAGRIAERQERWTDAVAAYESSLKLSPSQPMLRWSLFQALVKLGRYTEAERQADWFMERIKSGEHEHETRLAEMWTLLSQPVRALPYWKRLHELYPDASYFALEYARAHFALGQAGEAERLLDEASKRFTDVRIFEAGAEIQASLAQPEKVIEWANRGLALERSPVLLQLKAESADLLNRSEEATDSAQQLLALDLPDRTETAIRILGNQWMRMDKRDEAMALYQNALVNNPDLQMARMRLREIETLENHPKEAAEHAEYMTRTRPWDLAGWERRGASLAEAGQFRGAIRMLEPRVHLKPADAVPVLIYRRLTAYDYPGRNTVRQFTEHLEWLSKNGYRFILPDDLTNPLHDRRVMVVLVEPEPSALPPLDALLERLDARVVHARRTAPGSTLPYAGTGETSARWRMASSGPLSPAIVPGHAAEMETTLTRRLQAGEHKETDEELGARLDRILAATAKPLAASGPPLLVYPGGDYGNHAPVADPRLLEILREKTGQHFGMAIFHDETGFIMPEGDALRIPGRVVPSDWGVEALGEHLKSDNPVATAQLQLAKILAWHQQNEKAEYWFAEAAANGAPALDTAFNRGVNAWRAGDPDRAWRMLTEAQRLSPDDEKIAGILREIHLDMAPRLEAYGRAWDDSDDRSFHAFGLRASSTVARPSKPDDIGHALRVEAFGESRTYESENTPDQDAMRYGGSARLRLAPETYVDGSLWREDYEGHGANDFIGGRLGVRVPVRWIGGYVHAAHERDTMETVETIRADVQSRNTMAGLYARVLDVFDLFANGSYYDRDDENQSWVADGRFLYRVTEWPYLGVGYAWRFGDSDMDPPEYYAPMDLQEHHLYLGVRGTWRALHFIGHARMGYSREMGREWDFVWGGRARLEADVTDRVVIFVEAIRQESPTYDCNTYEAGVNIRF